MARDTQFVLASTENTAAYLFEPLDKCCDVQALSRQEKNQRIQQFFNRYILLSRSYYIIDPKHFDLKTIFIPILQNLPAQFQDQFEAWRMDQEFAEILSSLDIALGYRDDFFNHCKDRNNQKFITTVDQLFVINPKNKCNTSLPLTQTVLFESTAASFRESYFDRSIMYLRDFLERAQMHHDHLDRATLVIEVLYQIYTLKNNISYQQLYFDFIRAIKELFYFDDEFDVNHMRQLIALKEAIAHFKGGDEFDGAIRQISTMVPWQSFNREGLLRKDWRNLSCHRGALIQLDNTPIRVSARPVIEATLDPAASNTVNAKEKPETLLEHLIFYLALLVMVVVISGLIFASKGLFGAALPFALPKCIAIAAAISAACVGVIAKVDRTTNRLVRNIAKAISWLLKKLFCMAESGVEPAPTSTNPIFDAASGAAMFPRQHDADGDASIAKGEIYEKR
ncbi:MAG: hypothetical protein K0U23_03960 [Gammaproteobacteria bacterium]|nr:hypothetical protein [Gammaproteobacteria bacterium]